jgi:outer membrane protein OmpA-like peptidoglycan-associated protein
MKKLKHALLTCATAAMLAACTTPSPTAIIGFNYEVDNAKANGIVQVFDLSGNTVVQVRGMNPRTTQFLDVKNVPIHYKVVGESAVLSGMHDSFTVSTSAAASRVRRKQTAPGSEGIALAVAPAAPTPADALNRTAEPEGAIVAEIARIREELAELKAILAAASARDAAPTVPALAVSNTGKSENVEPSVVIVSFPNNSRQFAPAQEQRTKLLALSHTAEQISVRGFTDSEVQTQGSVALAKARAEAAKRYLVSMGVSAAKIVVGFDGAGNFIAENSSSAGRAANRRVEIGGS